MSLYASGHKVKELLIIPPEGEPIDCRLQSMLISYFEDVSDSSFHWEIDLADTDGRLSNIRSGFNVVLRIEHPSGDIVFDDDYPLFISNIKNIINTAKKEVFTIQCESMPALNNQTTRIYRKYKGQLHTSVKKILTETLEIPQDRLEIEDTSNAYSFMGNYKRPFHAIGWLCPKGIPAVSNSKTAGSAGYFFHETLTKFRFASIDGAFASPSEFEYRYEEGADPFAASNNFRISSMPKWKLDHDIMSKLRRGQYRSTNWYLNIVDKKPEFLDYKYRDSVNNQVTLSNDEENIPLDIDETPSRIMLSTLDFGTLSSGGKLDTPQNQAYYQAQGTARYAALFSQSLNITVPMNIGLHVGLVIKCTFPKINMSKTDHGTAPQSGFYMIRQLSHKFSSEGDFTGLTLVRDSYTRLT
tara:strand:- start:26514 stop:27749 length:1236 start_codon:yes stop_codon:yes gene_type:complete